VLGLFAFVGVGESQFRVVAPDPEHLWRRARLVPGRRDYALFGAGDAVRVDRVPAR
jgi:hypothetical protein